MRLAALRSLLVALVLMVALSVPATPGAVVTQDDDASYLADIIGARDTEQPLSDPLSGSLVQQEAFASVEAANVSTTDFTARVVFQNPEDDSAPWDFGFDFGRSGDASQRVMVDSTGVWRYSPYPDGASDSGPASALDTAPGGINTLDLVVDGETGILGVNGEYVTSISLPPAVASDVFVTSGVYGSTTIDGREIPFEDFSVWALPDPNAVAEVSPTPSGEIISLNQTPEAEQTPGPVQDEPPSDDDLAMFAYLIEAQSGISPVAGPFTANLKEEVGPIAVSWANVDLADFHATATFTVPDTASDVPWDIGFMFRVSNDGTLRVAVDQDSRWFASVGEAAPASSGTLTNLDATPGAENTLDLLVSGDRAVLGVNGTYAASIELPAGGTAGDVAAGAGFFTDQQQAERVTAFRDFMVRPFDLAALDATPPPTTATISPEAEQQFAGYVASTQSIAPLVGPLAGTLEEGGAGSVALANAGVSLADFGAVATFVNPDDLTTTWDGGIQFRTDANGANRIVLRSNGQVQVVQGDGSVAIAGMAASFDAAPGAVNTLQVFVAGDQALVGVNDTLVADIALVVEPVLGDVQVGAGFFGEDQVAGRVTTYDGFSVWSIA
ncbi:MAG: hypothetical protein U0Z70_02615 [Thermomicrobiales bacterium]